MSKKVWIVVAVMAAIYMWNEFDSPLKWERQYRRVRTKLMRTGEWHEAQRASLALLATADYNQKARAELLARQVEVLAGDREPQPSKDFSLAITGAKRWKDARGRAVFVSITNKGDETLYVRASDFFARADTGTVPASPRWGIGDPARPIPPGDVLTGAVGFYPAPTHYSQPMDILYIDRKRYAHASAPRCYDKLATAADAIVRVVPLKDSYLAADAQDLLRDGERCEYDNNWQDAIAKYQESLAIYDREEPRQRIAAIQQLLRGLKFEAQEEWAQAAEAYRAAGACANQEFVRKHLAQVEATPLYRKCMAEAARLEEAGDEAAALAQYEAAIRHARAGGIRTDAEAKAETLRLDMPRRVGRRKRRMTQLLEEMLLRKQYAGVLLACRFYETDPGYRGFTALLSSYRDLAKEKRAGAKSPPKQVLVDRVRLRNGQVRTGQIVSRTDDTIALRVRSGYTTKTLAIGMHEIAEIKRGPLDPQEVRNQAAIDLFAQALKKMSRAQELDAADLIGRIVFDYGQTTFARDPEQQKKLVDEVLPDIAGRLGHTLAQMQRRIVPLAEERADFDRHRCPQCKGTGRGPCAMCGGTGRLPAADDKPILQGERPGAAPAP